jgi:alkylhydroperoxidase family enzyme
MAASRRLEPLGRHDIPELEGIFSQYERITGFVANALLIMARRPALVRAQFGLLQARMVEGAVEPQLIDLVGLVATLSAGCKYSEAHRAQSSARHGIPPEKFQAVNEFETSPLFTDRERAALRLARDSAAVPNAVTDDHFVELRKYFSDEEIIDIVARSCHAAWMNRWNDTVATPIEEDSMKAIVGLDPEWEPGKHRVDA